jgi:hypothetical protein
MVSNESANIDGTKWNPLTFCVSFSSTIYVWNKNFKQIYPVSRKIVLNLKLRLHLYFEREGEGGKNRYH